MDEQMGGWKHGWVGEWTNGSGIVLVLEEVSEAGQEVSMGEMKLSILGTQEVTDYVGWPVLMQ